MNLLNILNENIFSSVQLQIAQGFIVSIVKKCLYLRPQNASGHLIPGQFAEKENSFLVPINFKFWTPYKTQGQKNLFSNADLFYLSLRVSTLTANFYREKKCSLPLCSFPALTKAQKSQEPSADFALGSVFFVLSDFREIFHTQKISHVPCIRNPRQCKLRRQNACNAFPSVRLKPQGTKIIRA